MDQVEDENKELFCGRGEFLMSVFFFFFLFITKARITLGFVIVKYKFVYKIVLLHQEEGGGYQLIILKVAEFLFIW